MDLLLSRWRRLNFYKTNVKKKNHTLGFAETCLKNFIKETEIEIKGYSHETINRINRDGGGVIVYIRKDLTYQILISTSDEMCSMVAIHINELKDLYT